MDAEVLNTILILAGVLGAGAAGGLGHVTGRRKAESQRPPQPGWNPEDTGRFHTVGGYSPPAPQLDPAVVATIVDQVARAMAAPLQEQIAELRKENARLRDEIAKLHTLVGRLDERNPMRRHRSGNYPETKK